MIIEHVESLKTWLTNKLSPICDAEPSALAKYVCALVKKDKPEQDLRDICLDQLDVFLQQKTKPFVDELFEALKSQAYFSAADESNNKTIQASKVSVTADVPPLAGEKAVVDGLKKKGSEISSTSDDKDSKSSSIPALTTIPLLPLGTTGANTKGSAGDAVGGKDSKEPVRDTKDSRGSVRGDRANSRDHRDSWRDERGRDSIRDRRDTLRDGRDLVRDGRDFARDGRDGPRDREHIRETPREGRESARDGEAIRDGKESTKDSKDGIKDARDIIRERESRDTREVREPRDRDIRERERDRDFRRRRSRSRSFSPRRREHEDRRRRFEERPRYSPDRRWGRRRSWSRSPRRNRSPLDSRVGRPRSRSPRLRSRSPRLDRFRSFRSRTRSRSRPRSWSIPGSGGGRARSRSLSNARQPDSRGSTPVQDNDYSTLISSSTNDLPAVTSTVGLRPAGEETRLQLLSDDAGQPPPSLPPGGRSRCQNFEEKGFCMLGDICPFDHGTDPVVVEDVTMPGALSGNTSTSGVPTSGTGVFVPPDVRVPPPGHMGMRINVQQAPPIHVEPYMPEAPGLQGPPRPMFMGGPSINVHRPPPGLRMNRPPPPVSFFSSRREVVMNRPPRPMGDEGVDLMDSTDLDKEPSRIVIPTKRPFSAIDNNPGAMNIGPPPPRMAHINQHHHIFGSQQLPPQPGPSFTPQVQPPPRRGFDFSRLGTHGGFRPQGPKQPFKTGNLTLEVRKIPPEMNDIAKLNEHFGKFGTLTNIQVKYQGDLGAALISFSNNREANAAYRSPEPVFNNRFIKLFWHNPEKAAEFDMEKDVGNSPEDGRDIQMQSTTRTGGRVGDGIDHPSLMLPVRPTIPPAHKLQLDNTKSKSEVVVSTPSSPMDTTPSLGEKSIVYTSSVGNLKKTVFNPTATSTSGGTSPVVGGPKGKGGPPSFSPTAVKTADYVSRMEAIKRAEQEKKVATVKQAELEVKRQELLAKQIQQQKVLLETLEKRKNTMGDAEKQNLLQTLRKISDAIDKVKFATGAKKTTSASFTAPTPAQFKYVSQDQARSKEIQELETDIMEKQSRGEDTTGLRMKMQELINKAPTGALGIPASYGRGRGWNRSGWTPRGRGRGAMPVVGRTHLDNRPKTLEVKGFDLTELEEVKAHFLRFGEMDRVELVEEIPSIFFTFSTRPSAEMAIAQGGRFKKKNLIVRWNQRTQKITRAESTQSSELDEDLSITLGSMDDDVLLEERKPGTPDLDLKTPEDLTLPVQELPASEEEPVSDVRSVVETETSEAAQNQDKVPLYKRSLSDDLLMGDEHFTASYTDDEDDDDITVTLSTVPSSELGYNVGASFGEGEEGFGDDDSEDLANLGNPTLDYDEGSWS